jgi:hypothetical protein
MVLLYLDQFASGQRVGISRVVLVESVRCVFCNRKGNLNDLVELGVLERDEQFVNLANRIQFRSLSISAETCAL